MVATVQQSKTSQASNSKKNAGLKTPPPNKKDEKSKSSEAKREEGQSLAGAVTKSIENTAGAVASAGADVVKEGAKSGLSSVIKNMIYPLRMQLSVPPLSFAVGPITSYMTNKLDGYMKENQIDIGMQPSQIVHELLFGNVDKLSGEVTDMVGDFIQKSMPVELKSAIESGSPTKIALATGTSLTSGAKGLLGQLFNQPNSNKFTSIFKFFGQKIPFVNKLSPKFQPWVAGAGIFMFGGLAVRLAVKLFKFLIGGTVLATLGVFGTKMFNKMTKPAAGMMPGAKKPGGGALGALGALAGGGAGKGPMGPMPGAAAKPGIGDMLSTATNLMGMLGGRK